LGDWSSQEGYGPSRWRYGCTDCGAYSGTSTLTQAEAIAAWNARQSATTEALAAMEQAGAALREHIYETTHLSPEEDDGSHWCSISKNCLNGSRQALATLTEQIERMRGEVQTPSGGMTGE
jgi:hypothetical protein